MLLRMSCTRPSFNTLCIFTPKARRVRAGTHVEAGLRAHLLHEQQRGNLELEPTERGLLCVHEPLAQPHVPPAVRHQGP